MLLRVLGPAPGVCLALGPVFPEVAHSVQTMARAKEHTHRSHSCHQYIFGDSCVCLHASTCTRVHHPHTRKDKQRTKDVRSSLTRYAPPDQIRLGPLCATSGNTGPSAKQTPGAGPSTRRSTDYGTYSKLATIFLPIRPQKVFCVT